jgi:hypothetical protein
MFGNFWKWYNKKYTLNLIVATSLFSLQIIHLFWLLGHVIMPKLGFFDLFTYLTFLNWPLIIVDYTEIPALISTSLVYINDIRNKNDLKPWLYLLFLNIQWLHIFWITDEFVQETFYFSGILWWLAIVIDYLELPVILDTLKKLKENFGNKDSRKLLKIFEEE